MKEKVVCVAINSLQKAKAYELAQNYGRAFAHWLVYFKLVSEHRNLYETDFVRVLCKWGLILESRGQVADLCKCYIHALHYYPKNLDILNNFGAHLIR